MLLSHTSSLSKEASVYRPDWERIGKNGYDPLFRENVRPGTQYEYADYNGALFGCLIEAITGESVQNYMSRTVFAPLGLTAAYSPVFLPAGTATKDMLYTNGRVGLSVAGDRRSDYNNTADPRNNNGYTVGRLYINTASLTKLARMMLSGGELDGVRILQRETVSLMEADQPGLAQSPYGLSNVRHSQFPRGTWYGHQGRYIGLTSNVYYQVDTGITMALVMNGYDYQLQDNIVMPAVTILNNMERLEQICLGQP
jgi:CubicO group peptidase (beta-lactamase class C family)